MYYRDVFMGGKNTTTTLDQSGQKVVLSLIRELLVACTANP
jgi:hypothetical protein